MRPLEEKKLNRIAIGGCPLKLIHENLLFEAGKMRWVLWLVGRTQGEQRSSRWGVRPAKKSVFNVFGEVYYS